MTARMLAMAIGLLLLVPAAASAGTVGGTVTDEAGVGVGGVHVEIFKHPGGGSAGATWTNASGQFTITGSAGTYDVLFESHGELLSEWHGDTQDRALAQPLTVPETGMVTADAVLSPGGAISGTVTDSQGAPVSDVLVRASDAEGATIFGASAPFTDQNGHYRLRRLPTGDYKIRFDPPSGTVPLGEDLLSQFYRGAWFAEDAAELTVAAGETTLADWALPREAVLAGDLRFPDGSPAQAIVTVFDLEGRRVGGGAVDGNGHWQIRGLPAGQFKLAFSSAELLPYAPGALTPPAPFFVETEYYKDRYSLANAQPVTATAGAISSGFDTTLTRAGTITGVLTTSAGVPLKGVKVFLVRSDGRRAGPFRSDYKGRYTAFGLRAGSWTVGFVPESAGLLNEYYDNSPTRAGATPITVSYGKTVEANAAISRAARITGLVTDESRGSIPGVRVSAYNGFNEIVASAVTTASGSYSLGRLPTGAYRIGFVPPEGSGFESEFYDNIAQLADAASVWATAGSTTPSIDAELAGL